MTHDEFVFFSSIFSDLKVAVEKDDSKRINIILDTCDKYMNECSNKLDAQKFTADKNIEIDFGDR